MNNEYAQIIAEQQRSQAPRPMLETVVMAILIWSDSTHLASFGSASLWPIYMFLGNQSKYARACPSKRPARTFAYFPSVRHPFVFASEHKAERSEKLPDSVQDFIRDKQGGRPPSRPILAHCRRDLFHGCWTIILDDEFLEAYEHGIVIDCGDGIRRRVYLRLFTYSADYPEKYVFLR